ncbi:MAG: division/cell wall cluster transcriptional repressor MraZ [Bacilli bacterium]
MLIGEFHHNIDDKNRLIIPAKFRDEIGDKFVLTRGLDGCLFIYSLSNWEKIVDKLKNLPFTKKDARTFMRFFLSGATICEFDKQGRININTSLIEYAKIKKECAIIGVNDRLEIWALEDFNNLMDNNKDNLSDIAENLFSMDFEM